MKRFLHCAVRPIAYVVSVWPKSSLTLRRELTRVCPLKGFTLIELLISISVLGILATAILVLINPVKRQNQAKDSTIQADIGQIATGAESYHASQNGSFPMSLDVLVTSGDMKNIPTPPNAVSYTYVATNSGGGACDGTANNPCTLARISNPMASPAVAGDLWCWQSVTGRAQELSVAACTP